MKIRNLLIVASMALLCGGLSTSNALAQRTRAVKAPTPADPSTVTVPVTVDLNGVVLQGQPARLGGYVVEVTFDPATTMFVNATAGADFDVAPTFTNPDKANADGVVRLTAARPGEDGPSGLVSLAVLTFRPLQPGGSVDVGTRIESLASSLMRGPDGNLVAASIPVDQLQRPAERDRADDN